MEWLPRHNGFPGNDTKQSDGEFPVILDPFIAIVPRLAPDRVLSKGQIELNRGFESLLFLHLNWVFMLIWIIWNKTVFTFNSMYSPVGW